MRKALTILTVVILGSCSSNSNNQSNQDSISQDSSLKGAIITDTAGAANINADTSGMGEAR